VQRYRFSPLILFLSAIVIPGCDSQLADSPEPGYFSLQVLVEPGTFSITPLDTLRVSFESVKIFRGPDLVRWSVIADTPKVVNLFDYTNGVPLPLGDLRTTCLPAGEYAQVRVKVLLPDTVMHLAGRAYRSEMPAAFDPIVRIDTPVSLHSGASSRLTLVLRCDSSLAFTQGRCQFTPRFTIQ
jgi:hypothetical protein